MGFGGEGDVSYLAFCNKSLFPKGIHTTNLKFFFYFSPEWPFFISDFPCFLMVFFVKNRKNI